MLNDFASSLLEAVLIQEELAVAMTAMAIPDFAAGLVYGLTGDNQLEEFEKCFQSSEDLISMGTQVCNEFKADEFIHAFEDLGDFASMLQPLMSTCSSDLQDDMAKIAQWADIFNHPAKLLERVGKNFVLYHHKIH